MPSITFVSGTVVPATWLNDVNVATFTTIPTLAPLISPSFTTPSLGVATATSINKITITTPATGATLTIPDGTTATVSGTNTGDQLVFKTVAVSGQPNVVATSGTDTLTLVAGSGVGMTTNAAARSVTLSSLAAPFIRSARTSNTILGIGDSGSLIDITSGTFTQTFTAAATLGSQWYCYIRNSGTGDITVDPNGGETIDGLTSYIIYPNECRIITCDGTGFYSVVLAGFHRPCSSTFTFTRPPGYSGFRAQLIGGGGGGGSGARASTASSRGGGGGGAGGAMAISIIDYVSCGASETVTIGAGGAGGTAITVDTTAGNSGTAGGATSFGTHLQAGGGAPGIGGTVGGGDTVAAAVQTGFPEVASTAAGYNSGAGARGKADGAGVTATAIVGSFAAAGGGGGAGQNGGTTTNLAGGAGGAITAATASGRAATVAGGAGGTSGGVAAVAGTASTANSGNGGSGGGGGYYRTGVVGGTGGAGGAYGGGGGGGGTADNGFNSGAGGAGANGFAVLMGEI